jgi:hypothetical protein
MGEGHPGHDVEPLPVADQRLDGGEGPLAEELDDGDGLATAAETEDLSGIRGDPGTGAETACYRAEQGNREGFRAREHGVDAWLVHWPSQALLGPAGHVTSS